MSETIRATRPEPPPHVSAEIEIAHAPLPKWAIGEFFGTFLLVFFGCGSVCASGHDRCAGRQSSKSRSCGESG